VARLGKAGFSVQEQIPIAPEPSGRIFMLFDELWHVRLEDKVELSQKITWIPCQFYRIFQAGLRISCAD